MFAIVAQTGMVVNEDIVLIDFINRRRAEGRSVREALILAGHQRLRAVLMTTLTTIAGLITMAIGLPFSIAWSPMATCFVAGLTVSSAMTLLIVPVLYESMERVAGRVRNLLPRRSRPHD
ncbi:MAG: efflux RND transporter permease subunit [Planctomycetes bacterium]|nr:efflux RND transporter permease subunit [Planctomycetota bacterium]